ncbi:MmpS family transport accessory protein [Micromonospora sp. MS34]|uniref:MmpS family transport accessory protein n=1 Tax=Micromonospora sp. MS34 TaxID=3385971 RepID=UPI0039A3DE0F
MSAIDPAPAWTPPDPPRVTTPVEAPPGEFPALSPGGDEDSRWWSGGERFTTAVLAGLAVVALAVFGCLGAVLLPLNLPDRPTAAGPATPPEFSDPPAADPTTPPPSADPSPTHRPASTPSNGPGRFTVAYSVTGQGPADIQYRDADGYLVQLDGVSLPWRRTVRTDDPTAAWVQAGKADDKGGRSITCALSVNGGRPVTETVGPGGWRCGCGG